MTNLPTAANRLGCLFGSDGRCFNVAVDHGLFNEPSFLSGIEDMRRVVSTLIAAAPDAIQLSPGQARLLRSSTSSPKPALVLRTDVANIYGNRLPRVLFSELIAEPVEQAVQLEASCVVVNLLLLPDQPELHRQCVRNVAALKPRCEKFAMPLVVEPLVMQANEKAGGYMVDGDLERIRALVRQAVELGADIIKADPCDDPTVYHRVIEIAGDVPVLVRGGGRVADDEILKRTRILMDQGAKGIVYGRNVTQHADPAKMTRALMAVVHNGQAADEALKILQG